MAEALNAIVTFCIRIVKRCYKKETVQRARHVNTRGVGVSHPNLWCSQKTLTQSESQACFESLCPTVMYLFVIVRLS